MNIQQVLTVQDCARGSLLGELTFPQVVGRLAEMGAERYHADYSRGEITYYMPDGDSVVVATPHDPQSIGQSFVSSDVAAAVLQSQRNEHSYVDFVRKTMKAGCVGYVVQLTGRRVVYFGRNGESHVELFPSAPVN